MDYPGVVQVLLEAGANPDATDPCGDTALHMSLKARVAPIVAVLCSKGVNVNQRSGEACLLSVGVGRVSFVS